MKGLMKKSAVIILSSILMTGTTTATTPMIVSAKTISVDNPIRSGKTVTYDYVYFGSYPQTEITGEDLTSEIIGAKYDKNGDATINGIKYHKIDKGREVAKGDYFGTYEVGGIHYFKYEPIKWRVLQDEGEQLFLMSDIALDWQYYNNEDNEDKSWKDSTIRQWLNNDFLNRAFNKKEKKEIIKSKNVSTDPNFFVKIENTETTNEKVFILSYKELTSKKYGFLKNRKKDDEARKLYVSDYGNVLGASRDTSELESINKTVYALRSSAGNGSEYNMYVVYEDGVVSTNYKESPRGICPAIRVKSSSKLLLSKNPNKEVIIPEPEGRVNPSNPVLDKETGVATYDYVYFGSYPQTEVSGSALTSEIKNAVYIEDTSDSIGSYEVAEVNGERYVRLHHEEYYKCEPIKWRVLQNDGEQLFLMADKILDYNCYFAPGLGAVRQTS